MKITSRTVFFASVVLATLFLIIYLFVTHDLVLLQPKGSIAQSQKNLLIFATLLSLIVLVPVFSLMTYIGIKYREGNKAAKYSPDDDGNKILETFWWGIPIAIIVLLSVVTWRTSHSLDPFKPLANNKKPLTVQVVALQWKWLFIYPEQQIASVNYLQIPEDTPVNFQITSDAPMNSFWIPQLGGQIYAMSGMATELHLIADSTGVYDGYSANISGKGFADMKFKTYSTSQNEFDAWVNGMKQTQSSLDESNYASLAKPGTEVPTSSFSNVEPGFFSSIVHKYMYQAASISSDTMNKNLEGNN